ncbi:MAG: hypothetical protein R3324_18695 [Halobacteriales archaeon]|nr:hypothetical protein [Halobacteriales archaeon]
MTRHSNRPIEGITRRTALRTGVAVSSGLAFGGAAVGTVGARRGAVAEIVPEHFFVRAEGDEDPDADDVGGATDDHADYAPVPDPADEIVERRLGHPVDDGTQHEAQDGHHFTWAEFSDLGGLVNIRCTGRETHVNLAAHGLIPGGLYTAWVVVFGPPGFDFDSRNMFPFGAAGTAAEHVVAAGPLGSSGGGENVFRANHAGIGALTARHPAGPLGIFGTVGDCLLEEFEVHIVGDFHLDDLTHGSVPGAPGTHVEQFGAVIKEGEPI